MTGVARLTIHDQLLINLCGWVACDRLAGPNRQLFIDQIARVIPNCSEHPLIEGLAHAAARVVRQAGALSSPDWLMARMELDAALQVVFFARAAQAAAQVWPEENLAPAPEPGTQPAAEEPAHAAE